MSSRSFSPALILWLAAACALSAACAGPSTRRPAVTAEAPLPAEAAAPAASPAAAATESADASKPPAPGAADVGGAVERIFKGALTPGPEPSFAVGDFNGDDSQDLAVAVSPAPGRLGEVNDELANWIVKDPFAPAQAASASYGEASRRPLVGEAETLIAVVHGYGAGGWRDPRATQTYVLKDAAGGRIKARARKEALASGEEGKMPRIVGDVIDESGGGRVGFIYYDGARYAWYNPRGYRKPPPARAAHGGAVKAAQQ
ncbi:MAG TPA: FG-GAP repeat protein [Pyrinomonadaceae bacterium]|jgi:hypothetical protein